MGWKYTDEWAAGFFDGEGSVCVSRRKRTAGFIEHHLAVQVVQVDPRPIHALRARFGGSLRQADRNGKPFFYLRFHGTKAEHFLKTMYPHLLVKREEAGLALQLRELIGVPGRRMAPGVFEKKEKIYNELRKVKDGVVLHTGDG